MTANLLYLTLIEASSPNYGDEIVPGLVLDNRRQWVIWRIGAMILDNSTARGKWELWRILLE